MRQWERWEAWCRWWQDGQIPGGMDGTITLDQGRGHTTWKNCLRVSRGEGFSPCMTFTACALLPLPGGRHGQYATACLILQ